MAQVRSSIAAAVSSAESNGHRMSTPAGVAGEQRSTCTSCGLSVVVRKGHVTGLALRTRCRPRPRAAQQQD